MPRPFACSVLSEIYTSHLRLTTCLFACHMDIWTLAQISPSETITELYYKGKKRRWLTKSKQLKIRPISKLREAVHVREEESWEYSTD